MKKHSIKNFISDFNEYKLKVLINDHLPSVAYKLFAYNSLPLKEKLNSSLDCPYFLTNKFRFISEDINKCLLKKNRKK